MLRGISNKTLPAFPSLSGGSSFNSPAIDVEKCQWFNLSLSDNGNLVGTAKLQSSNDGATNWNDLSGTSQSYPGAGGQSAQFNVSEFGFPFVRLVWTYSSGAGTMAATINRKT